MPPKRIAIVQSSYIPWKGYFDLINSVDHFVLLDDVQYTKRDWRSRNCIKTPAGIQWLSIPVHVKGRFNQRICETRIVDSDWREKHWKSIERNYSGAANFNLFGELVEQLYLQKTDELLSEINHSFILAICDVLGITTPISWSMDYAATGVKSAKLLEICQHLGGDQYVSGPAAKAYLDEDLFSAAGIEVVYFDYTGYPSYQQLHGTFVHEVSILDLVFCAGRDAPKYMKSFANDAQANAPPDIM